MDDQIGRPACGHQAHKTVHKGLFIQNIANGAIVIPKRGDLGHLRNTCIGQRIAHGRMRVHETGARQMQTHKLHQHLVGIGRAVKGAGAWPVIRGHLGLHQFLAPDLACGEFLAHLRLFIIG